MAGILRDVRIVDMSDGIAGSVAAMLLAESGADVVLVEPPKGNPLRGLSGFRTWHRSKRSVMVNLQDPNGRDRLESLLASADVLIHQMRPTRAQAIGIDDKTLAQRHQHLIACSILGWPINHPEADRPVDELLVMARLGVCDEQLPMGRDGPVYVRFPLGTWGAVYLATSGIVARLLVRQRTGQIGPIHTSLVQGALVPMGMHWSRIESPTESLAIGMPKEGRGSQTSLFECSDGVWIHLMRPPDPSPLMQEALAAMGEDEVARANASAPPVPLGAPSQHRYANQGANAVAFRTRPSAEWLEDLWAHDVPAQPALAYGAIYGDEQSRANGYVIELDDPEVGRITVPGVPLTIHPPQEIKGPAPRLNQHADQVATEWREPRAKIERQGIGQRWPLEGIRVLDLGNYLAGPYGPMLMADLGADVVKLEATTGDPMRPGWPFAGCQRGKRAVALDLKSPAARPAFEALVRWADVIHHNLRMPAARRLGVDFASVRAINPDIIYCHASSYGPIGPRANWPGFDQLFQAQCGWEVLGAGRGNPPMWHRFGFMDHQCALSSVLATLLALFHRATTGEGQEVAASLLGPGVLTASETFVGSDGQVVPVPELDAAQTGIGPGHRIIKLADGWIAVAATEDTQLDALCSVAGAVDPERIPEALVQRRCDDVLTRLATAEVPAERVREAQRYPFFDDPGNQMAGLVAEYNHLEWGNMQQPGAMWYFGDLDVRIQYPPPVLGEHTVEVLMDVGLAREHIDQLIAEGVALAR
jgi:crotonobetainyl-CoA:carnitine CoA-transferase CaiB-like acyl-CoA transferase